MLNLIVLICLNSIPDSLKGMLKGVIKALELQKKCAVVNLIGHWGINLSLQLILGFYYDLHLFGLWAAKIILEIYILTSYSLLIYYQDWTKIAKKAQNRLDIDDTRAQFLKGEIFSPIDRRKRNRSISIGGSSVDNKEDYVADGKF